MRNAAALRQARQLASEGLHHLADVVDRVRETRPASAATLVASARAHALDTLATFGTCLHLARLDSPMLARVAEDVALGLLGVADLRTAAARVSTIPLPAMPQEVSL